MYGVAKLSGSYNDIKIYTSKKDAETFAGEEAQRHPNSEFGVFELIIKCSASVTETIFTLIEKE